MENSFSSFAPVSKQDWIDKAIADLKGGDFNEKLVWKSEEGLEIMPFYTQEDLEQLEYLKQYQNGAFDADNAQFGARFWLNRQKIHVADDWVEANKRALEALQNGADAVYFDLTKSTEMPPLDKLLKGILFPYCEVCFRLPDDHFSFFGKLQKYFLETRGCEPKELRGSMEILDQSNLEYLNRVQISKIYPNFRVVVISHSEETKEVTGKVAELLHNAIERINYLVEQGLALPVIFKDLEIHYRLGNNYFFEIAGLRALRMLFTGVAKEYGFSEYEPNQLHIHAETSVQVDENTQDDPEWNMISNTTQAMSGLLGGCNSLSIEAHNAGISEVSDFSLRIARNVSNLLREESYFDKVADPAAGSYYIETLTHQIAEKAWEKFQKI